MSILRPKYTVELRFEAECTQLEEKPIRKCLSAVENTGDGFLWLASDESCSIEQLSHTEDKLFGHHRRYNLEEYFDLPGVPKSEIDIESISFDSPFLWIIGSHSLKFGTRDGVRDLRITHSRRDLRRFLIARIPVINGEIDRDSFKSYPPAAVKFRKEGNQLTRALRRDEHLAPFLLLPSKTNGLDVEGMTVRNGKMLIGLRGPVLMDHAIILQVDPVGSAKQPNRLRLAKNDSNRRYEKHFVDLDGLGIRDLTWYGDDLLILAGPTMYMDGPSRLYILEGGDFSKQPHEIGEFKLIRGEDHPEGMSFFPLANGSPGLLVVYDAPSLKRLTDGSGVLADVFAL